MGKNLVGSIRNRGEYFYYKGKYQELEDTKGLMEKEGQYILDKVLNVNKNNETTLSKTVIIELKKMLNKTLERENLFRKQLKISELKIEENDSLKDKLKEFLKGDEILNKYIQKENGYLEIIKVLMSKEFIDKISTGYDVLSYSLAGGGKSYKDSEKDFNSRAIGKSQIESLVANILLNKNKKVNNLNKLTDLFFGKLDAQTRKLLLQYFNENFQSVLSEYIKESSEKLLKKNNKLIADEQLIKGFLKKAGHLFLENINKEIKIENQQIQTAIQNLQEGNLIPNDKGIFALKLDVKEYDSDALYKINMQGLFYEIEDKKIIQRKEGEIDKEKILTTFLNFLKEQVTTPEAKAFLADENNQENENVVNIKKILRQAFDSPLQGDSKKSNWDIFRSEMFSRSQISGLMGEIAGILFFSNNNAKVIHKGITLNKLGQQSNVDLSMKVGNSFFGIQVKNYTSTKSEIGLYEDTDFDIMNNNAERYIQGNLLKCLQYLLLNENILEELGIDITGHYKDFEDVLLINLSQFLRIDDLLSKESQVKSMNTFYLINGKLVSASVILCKSIIKAEEILENAEKERIVTIVSSNPEPTEIDAEEKVKDARLMRGYYKGKISMITDQHSPDGDLFYPVRIPNVNISVANIHFKGIKIKL